MVSELRRQADLFRAWVDEIPPSERRGEWDCEYPGWCAVRPLVLALLARDDAWTKEELEDFLFALARDNEGEGFADALAETPERLIAVALAALNHGEMDARWQLADRLGYLAQPDARVETLLLRFVEDKEEYVRRRALASLARIGSPQTEHYCERAWATGYSYQRTMALHALQIIGSEKLDQYLALAHSDPNEHVRAHATRIAGKNP